jgi:hypothetical protein
LVDEVLITRGEWTVKNRFGDLAWFFVAADYESGKNLVAESRCVLQRFGRKSLGAVYHPMTNAGHGSFHFLGPGLGCERRGAFKRRRSARELDEAMERARNGRNSHSLD